MIVSGSATLLLTWDGACIGGEVGVRVCYSIKGFSYKIGGAYFQGLTNMPMGGK